MKESINIINQCLVKLPKGPVKTQDAKVGEKAIEQLKAGDPTMGVLDD